MNKMITTLLSLSLLLSSCIYNHTAIIEELGNGYYYLGDGSESQILLSMKPKNYSSGITIVPQEVTEYDFDNSHIVAKSIVNVNGLSQARYWIIDKTKTNQSVTLLDSISFSQMVKMSNINLRLKIRK